MLCEKLRIHRVTIFRIRPATSDNAREDDRERGVRTVWRSRLSSFGETCWNRIFKISSSITILDTNVLFRSYCTDDISVLPCVRQHTDYAQILPMLDVIRGGLHPPPAKTRLIAHPSSGLPSDSRSRHRLRLINTPVSSEAFKKHARPNEWDTSKPTDESNVH